MTNTNYIIAALMGIIGLLMLLAAEGIVQVLVVVLGIYAIIAGITVIFAFAGLSADKTYRSACYLRGIVSVIVGLVCVVLPLSIAKSAWQIFVYIFAFYSLFSAVSNLVILFKARNLDINQYNVKRNFIEIGILFVLSIILFLLPRDFGFTIIRIGGAILLMAACAMGIQAWRTRDIISEDYEVADVDAASEE